MTPFKIFNIFLSLYQMGNGMRRNGPARRQAGRKKPPAGGRRSVSFLFVEADIGFVGGHAVDAALHDHGGVEAHHVEAALDDVPLAAGGEVLVLPFLLEALHGHAVEAFRAHERIGMDETGELVHGEEALHDGGRGLHFLGADAVFGDDAVAVGDDDADILFIHAFRCEELMHVMAVLGGEFFVVHVVEPADGFPIVLVFMIIVGQRAHGGAHAGGVSEQGGLGGVFFQNFFGLGQSQTAHADHSFGPAGEIFFIICPAGGNGKPGRSRERACVTIQIEKKKAARCAGDIRRGGIV